MSRQVRHSFSHGGVIIESDAAVGVGFVDVANDRRFMCCAPTIATRYANVRNMCTAGNGSIISYSNSCRIALALTALELTLKM
jgi:hypothetical protein